MLRKIMNTFLIVILAVSGYFLLSYHIVYFGDTSVKLLKKTRLTNAYTFVSVADKHPEEILVIDTLRQAGIGDLLVKMGRVTAEERASLEREFGDDPLVY